MAVVNVSSVSVTEGASGLTNIVFTITLDEIASSAVRIPYRVKNGTALIDQDFSEFNGEVGTATINARSSQTTLTFRAIGDADIEADESVVLELLRPLDPTVELEDGGPTQQAVGWILDDDAAGDPPLGLYATDIVVEEGDSGPANALIKVFLSRELTDSLTVPYTLVGGAATAGTDFTAASGSIVFLPGQTVAEIPIAALGDTLREGAESLQVAFDPPAEVASVAGGAITILSDDSGSNLPLLTVESEGQVEGDSGVSEIRFVFTLSEPAATTVTIPYRILPGTSVHGEDYRSFNSLIGQTSISAGQTQAVIEMRVAGDTAIEADESIQIEVLSPTGAQLPGGATSMRATGWILDDDSAPGDTVLGAAVNGLTLSETDGQRFAAFEIVLSRPPQQAVEVSYELRGISATSGADFVAGAGTAAFAQGQSSATVLLEVSGDNVIESVETLSVVVSSPAVAETLAGAAAILDDDDGSVLPVISVEGARTVENSGDTFLTFTLLLDRPAATTIDVPYRILGGTATQDVDYTANNAFTGSVRFSVGERVETLSIRLTNDAAAEVDETVLIEVDKPTNAKLASGGTLEQAVAFILDDDASASVPTLSLAVSNLTVAEGDVGVTEAAFDLTLSRPAPRDLTLPFQLIAGTAQAGRDFVAQSGSVTFREGERFARVPVQIFGDFTLETNETFALSFTPPPDIARVSGGLATIRSDDRVEEGDATDNFFIFDASTNIYYGFGGSDTVLGTAGDEFIAAGFGNDSVNAGAGRDIIFAGSGRDTVFGGGDDDTIRGEAEGDRIFGEDGADEINGDGGGDVLDGGRGADLLGGGDGNNILIGRGGDDRLLGGNGNDVVRGGPGDDALFGEGGADTIEGEDGVDFIDGGALGDVIGGGNGNDDLRGGGGNDVIWGGFGNDQLRGGDANDRLNGSFGNDQMWGENGNDTFDGGAGFDQIRTGGGVDFIVFAPGTFTDIVYDFDPLFDRIDVSAFNLGSAVPGAAFTQNGPNVVIGLQGNRLAITGVEIADLDEVFLF